MALCQWHNGFSAVFPPLRPRFGLSSVHRRHKDRKTDKDKDVLSNVKGRYKRQSQAFSLLTSLLRKWCWTYSKLHRC